MSNNYYEYIGPDKLKICGENVEKILNRSTTKEASKVINKIGSYNNVYWDESYGKVLVETNRTGTFEREKNRFFKETGWNLEIYKNPYSEMVNKVRRLIYEYEGRYEFLKKVSRNVRRAGDSSWIRISFLGGGKEVGRNSIFIQTPRSKVLLDCGINMKTSKGPLPAPEMDIKQLDAIVISHSHLDHTGGIAKLYAQGYRGPVYATEPTIALMRLLKRDLYRLKENPEFNKSSIDKMINHCIPIEYRDMKKIAPDIHMELYNAGHLPGSAGVLLDINGKQLFYTGDFDDRNTKLLPPADHDLPPLDVLITEATYSHESIPSQKKVERELIKTVDKTLSRDGTPIISTFAIGRSQEILSLLLENGYKNIYIDGMICEATKIVGSYPDYIKPNLDGEYQYIYSEKQREEAIENNGIIVTTSGMLTGGPIQYYLDHIGDKSKNTLILPGYMVENTPGNKLKEGENPIHINGKQLEIELEVKQIRFSGHADRSGLWSFLHKIEGSPETYVIHGEKENCEKLSQEINEKLGWSANAPKNLDAYRT
ncbi:putative metal-dependent RNase containing RNA-binding KH domain [Methanonatronarchaeum thermophilum]|uniref:Putative metal-dependent RNase containing RNA-binding KH domain n=1 Tax=Methanonatronarchaeum thermophilum TaxID=1927129 RepID=A0A1Y3GHZ5_9EURY|nr:MBL fold metallo-hydrolase RNA specificity domain-containing protein [Methanonatronarchaeum thermophilum]OUJ19055.1 putative metal-dependent RNase containing RNA-binding KH domain [Methanonatronarchaeum thermophilum]